MGVRKPDDFCQLLNRISCFKHESFHLFSFSFFYNNGLFSFTAAAALLQSKVLIPFIAMPCNMLFTDFPRKHWKYCHSNVCYAFAQTIQMWHSSVLNEVLHVSFTTESSIHSWIFRHLQVSRKWGIYLLFISVWNLFHDCFFLQIEPVDFKCFSGKIGWRQWCWLLVWPNAQMFAFITSDHIRYQTVHADPTLTCI